jgi:hypothetical protein
VISRRLHWSDAVHSCRVWRRIILSPSRTETFACIFVFSRLKTHLSVPSRNRRCHVIDWLRRRVAGPSSLLLCITHHRLYRTKRALTTKQRCSFVRMYVQSQDLSLWFSRTRTSQSVLTKPHRKERILTGPCPTISFLPGMRAGLLGKSDPQN